MKTIVTVRDIIDTFEDFIKQFKGNVIVNFNENEYERNFFFLCRKALQLSADGFTSNFIVADKVFSAALIYSIIDHCNESGGARPYSGIYLIPMQNRNGYTITGERMAKDFVLIPICNVFQCMEGGNFPNREFTGYGDVMAINIDHNVENAEAALNMAWSMALGQEHIIMNVLADWGVGNTVPLKGRGL